MASVLHSFMYLPLSVRWARRSRTGQQELGEIVLVIQGTEIPGRLSIASPCPRLDTFRLFSLLTHLHRGSSRTTDSPTEKGDPEDEKQNPFTALHALVMDVHNHIHLGFISTNRDPSDDIGFKSYALEKRLDIKGDFTCSGVVSKFDFPVFNQVGYRLGSPSLAA